jgi:hypothetical protein
MQQTCIVCRKSYEVGGSEDGSHLFAARSPSAPATPPSTAPSYGRCRPCGRWLDFLERTSLGLIGAALISTITCAIWVLYAALHDAPYARPLWGVAVSMAALITGVQVFNYSFTGYPK